MPILINLSSLNDVCVIMCIMKTGLPSACPENIQMSAEGIMVTCIEKRLTRGGGVIQLYLKCIVMFWGWTPGSSVHQHLISMQELTCPTWAPWGVHWAAYCAGAGRRHASGYDWTNEWMTGSRVQRRLCVSWTESVKQTGVRASSSSKRFLSEAVSWQQTVARWPNSCNRVLQSVCLSSHLTC